MIMIMMIIIIIIITIIIREKHPCHKRNSTPPSSGHKTWVLTFTVRMNWQPVDRHQNIGKLEDWKV